MAKRTYRVARIEKAMIAADIHARAELVQWLGDDFTVWLEFTGPMVDELTTAWLRRETVEIDDSALPPEQRAELLALEHGEDSQP